MFSNNIGVGVLNSPYFNNGLGWGGNGLGNILGLGNQTSSDTWLPERRARYNTKRRQKDLELIFSIWNEALPHSQVVNIANVPANIAKKYKRALNANRRELRRVDEEWDKEYRKHPMIEHNVRNMDGSPKVYSCEKLVPHNLMMLRLLKERIPTHKSKVIVDLPFNFRDNYDGFYDEGDKGVATIHFWANYRIGNAYMSDLHNDFEAGLRHIDTALAIIPPLREGEMPHQSEVMARIFRAKALKFMGDIPGAVAEYRICLASIRLLDHHGKVDMNDTQHLLIKKTTNFTAVLLGLTVEQKILEGATRPYFSHDERLDLMKELGFGMYSNNGLKCSCCGKTDLELAKLKKKLELCSSCKGVWYCGRECQKAAWKNGHSKSCGKTADLQQTMQVSRLTDSQLNLGHVCLLRKKHDSSILILMKDKSTDQIFDALTDQDYELDVGGEEGLGEWKETSNEYYYHTMYQDAAKEEEIREMYSKMGIAI